MNKIAFSNGSIVKQADFVERSARNQRTVTPNKDAHKSDVKTEAQINNWVKRLKKIKYRQAHPGTQAGVVARRILPYALAGAGIGAAGIGATAIVRKAKKRKLQKTAEEIAMVPYKRQLPFDPNYNYVRGKSSAVKLRKLAPYIAAGLAAGGIGTGIAIAAKKKKKKKIEKKAIDLGDKEWMEHMKSTVQRYEDKLRSKSFYLESYESLRKSGTPDSELQWLKTMIDLNTPQDAEVKMVEKYKQELANMRLNVSKASEVARGVGTALGTVRKQGPSILERFMPFIRHK